MVNILPLASLLLHSASVAHASLQIVSGATWTGTNTGAHIQAHGAGVVELDGTYYLIGEDKTNGSAFQNVNCYSSTDLVSWTYVGALLSQTSSGDLGPDRVVERPKVIYNASTGKYVLYMHVDSSSYGEAKIGVATGDTRENGLRIDALTDDYLNVTSSVYLFDDYEAPAMVKKNGYYFLFASHLSGWDPNDNVYTYSTNLSSGWSNWTTFATVGSDTYSSQTNYVLPVSDELTVYLGDRWVSDNLMASTYVWLPLNFSGTTVTMDDYVNWVPNVAEGGGAWTAGPGENDVEGEDGVLAGGAEVVDCTGCSGGEAAGYVGGSTGGSVTFEGVVSNVTTTGTGTGTGTTIRIKYENGDSVQRFANVSCNGGAGQVVAFLPTDSGQGTPGSSVVTCGLEEGDGNVVVVVGRQGNGTYGPDVDRIMVPVS
ncbi:hypothetical protein VMCG_08150 [Cytospora schulzeri]|uniref:CBM6 domain-containing protein n=1 Tax=Cytospora schulzeri TaxID=448051 RepID=A0A423VU77_9PEZI|nr:hypothetical protein VMCG_08150 [Valsa malicola]